MDSTGVSTGLDFISASYTDTDDSENENDEAIVENMNGTDEICGKNNNRRMCNSSESGSCDKLPVPEALRAMYSTGKLDIDKDVSDDHDGRSRSFPHLRGNWASFVYINYVGNPGLTWIVDCAKKLSRNCPELMPVPPTPLHTETEFHLSLSKTQVFKHHWIQPFITSISSKLKEINEFEICLDSLTIYINEEKSRTFVALEAFPSDSLYRLLAVTDQCLSEFDLEPYYDPPSFHVTFAWLLGDQREWTRNCLLPLLRFHWEAAIKDDFSLTKCTVNSIGFRTGNKGYTFPLHISRSWQ